MAKSKKNSKRKKKGSGSFLGTGILAVFRGAVKVFPLFMVAGVFSGLFLGVRHCLYADPFLSVKEIAVEPAPALSVGRRQDLDTQLLGRNILKVDLEKIARQLERSPEIQKAKVHRLMPSTLKVEVVTRKPAAFIQFSPAGTYGAVSEDGMILNTVKGRDNS